MLGPALARCCHHSHLLTILHSVMSVVRQVCAMRKLPIFTFVNKARACGGEEGGGLIIRCSVSFFFTFVNKVAGFGELAC